MDLPALKTFVSVAETGSFSSTAERLHLTQPAVSRRIQLLEEQCNARLFDRIGRQILLTEAGRCLLPNARAMLALAADSRQMLDDLAGSVRGQLRLLTSHHIGLHRLPLVLRRYKELYPEVKLQIQFFNSQEIHQLIQNGEGDLGITTEEHEPAPLLSETIWHDRLHFVVAPEHPLAGSAGISLSELAAYPALLPDERFHTGRIVRELFSARDIELKVDTDLSTAYLETLKALVSVGESWSVLPVTMLDERTAALDIAGVALARELVCIRHRERSLSRAARAFLDLLREQRDQD